jgi:glycosyltransferase involved in cell wall biosynthesis
MRGLIDLQVSCRISGMSNHRFWRRKSVPVSLDVLLPTFNRADLLPLTLDSLGRAFVPSGLVTSLIVIDNNSTDNTPEIVKRFQFALPFPVHCVRERQQGLSAALNAGIAFGRGDLVGMINDDEEVGPHWFETIYDAFAHSELDFIGGPCKPKWEAPKPAWVSQEFGGIIGWVDNGAERRQYGSGFNGMLTGGNAVIKRRVFEHIGMFNTNLGRTDKGLLSCEDRDLFERLLESRFQGEYLPDLLIYHHVPAARMTKTYYRRWCWGHGRSLGVLARRRNSGLPEIFGVPRWKIRHALTGLIHAAKGKVALQDEQAAFAGELRAIELAGFLVGRHGSGSEPQKVRFGMQSRKTEQGEPQHKGISGWFGRSGDDRIFTQTAQGIAGDAQTDSAE